jgi:hypothetical protein
MVAVAPYQEVLVSLYPGVVERIGGKPCDTQLHVLPLPLFASNGSIPKDAMVKNVTVADSQVDEPDCHERHLPQRTAGGRYVRST